MKYSNLILIIVIVIMASFNLKAQLLLTDYYDFKLEDDKILLRWEPQNSDEWVISKKSGYTIKTFRISSIGTEELVQTEIIKPAPNQDWINYENNANGDLYDFASGAKSFIFENEEGKAEQLQEIFDLKGNEQRGNKIALGFLLYSASYDFEIAKLSGLGYEVPFKNGYKYRFEIRTSTSSPILVNIDPDSYKESSVPEVMATWGDQEVEIQWNGSLHQNAFLGYMISKSEDGLNYEKITETPKTSSLGLLPEDSPQLQMTFRDSLEENDQTYWYKIEGFDYFGNISEQKQIIYGSGYESIGISPIIEFANQTENNHAHLKWYLPEEVEKLVKRYRITRCDTDKGPFEIVVDSIDKSTKEIKIPLEEIENHFRVEAVPHRGRPIGSFPVFVMGQDTTPPAVPEVIGAFLDSLGNIELKWKANKEQDLWGYRVFKSNFDEQEYGLVSTGVIQDTIFRDKVDIKFNTKNVFYKIYATDKRDNKSAFTLPIRIEKPDIFPPGMASLGNLEQRNDSIIINWTASASEDVVHHHIFRRIINEEYSWTLVGILSNEVIGEPFVDNNLEYGKSYAYTITALDEVGLESKPVYPKNITFERPIEKFEPDIKISHTFDEESKEILMEWEIEESSRLEYILVYRGEHSNKLGKFKILEGDAKRLKDVANDEESLFYKIKPIYLGQTENYFSETVEVDISRSE